MKSPCVALVFLFWILSCSMGSRPWHVQITHRDTYFVEESLSVRPLVYLPLLSAKGLDSLQVKATRSFFETYSANSATVPLRPADSLQTHLLMQLGADSLNRIYKQLFSSDMFILKQLDSLWEALGEQYLLIFRLSDGSRIKLFDGAEISRVFLEAEIWDPTLRSVVWRAETRQRSQQNHSDLEMLRRGLASLVRAVPRPRQGYIDRQEDW